MAFLCVLLSFLGCIPLRGYAVVPLSLVESALASYTVSAGYKWYSDGSGSEMAQSITNLYNQWLDVTDPAAATKMLEYFAQNNYVYMDNSGHIVIKKAAADVFQQFADWVQSNYSLPVGSDVPTEVVASSGGSLSGNNAAFPSGFNYSFWEPPISLTRGSVSVTFVQYGNTITRTYSGNYQYAAMFRQTISTSSSPYNYQVFFISLQPFTANSSSGNSYNSTAYTIDGNQFYGSFAAGSGGLTSVTGSPYNELRGRVTSIQAELALKDFYRFVYGGVVSESGGVAGLGATLAAAVADVVGQATDDDAVVIGVGAGVGATAQDIADLVAQGIKEGTLNPSVSITAEAVIDTPVQPYPDIDGLGLPELGAELVKRFPFCIPWDFVDVVKLFSAESVAPRFQFDIVPPRVKAFCNISQDTSIDLNMGDPKFEKIGVFCRWGSLIGFCFGLVLLTKRMIWTA